MISDTSDGDAELIEKNVALERSRDHGGDAPESWPVEAMREIVPREPDRDLGSFSRRLFDAPRQAAASN
jgi:hypothetical protein